MNSRERLLTVLNGGVPDRVPWIEISFHTAVAGRITGRQFRGEPSGFFPMDDLAEYEAEVDRWLELAKSTGLDAVACKYWLPTLAGPGKHATGFEGDGLVKSLEDLERESRRLPDIATRDYSCGEILIRKCRKAGIASFLETHFLVEQTVYSFGFERFCHMLYEDRPLVVRLMDFFADYSAINLRNLMRLKPDFLVIGEDVAYGHGPFVSPDLFRELFLPRYRCLAAEIRCPWVFHSDGNLLPIMEDLLGLGMNALHPIEPYGTMDIGSVKQRYGSRVVLAGNLDMNLIARGGPRDIEREVRHLFEQVGRHGGWILSSSNSIDGGANASNVAAMGKAVRETCIYAA